MKHPFLQISLIFALLLIVSQALAKPLSVALLLEHNGPSTWSSQLKLGLARAQTKFKIKTQTLVAQDLDRQEEVFKKAAQEFDLVLVATDSFHELLRDQARNFPKTKFGVIDASIRAPNTYCITFADEEAAFLAGAAAAIFAQNLPKDDDLPLAIGWLSGEDIPAMRSMTNAFEDGAKLIQADIRVILGNTHSFNDPPKAALEARRLLDQGVSVMMLAAGASNSGAVQEVKKDRRYLLGLDTDQKNIYPGHVLLSIQKEIAKAVYQIIEDTVKDNFQAKEIITYDLANHGVSLTDPAKSLRSNKNLGAIPRRLEELTHEIEAKNIKIKSLRKRTLCNCL